MGLFIDTNYPPNFETIDARFGITKTKYRPVFAWQDRIYNPFRVQVGAEIFAHESVHAQRMFAGPEEWWRRYIAEDNFRLAEETFAHVTEYEYLIVGAKDRNHRRSIFNYVAIRLCLPMYGYIPALSQERAEKILKWALKQKAKYEAPKAPA